MEKEKKSFIVYRVLLLLVMFLMVLIASGSIFAVLRPPNSAPLFSIGKKNAGIKSSANGETNVFNGIGRLRIPLESKGGKESTIIISIAFPYPPEDRPFTEELASKITNFRSITNDYFSSLPSAAFINFNEDTAKAEILKRYNAVLRLGRIETLYFTDLMILDN